MANQNGIRRRDLLAGALALAPKDDGFRPLFDGSSLRGWKRQPRSLAEPSLGRLILTFMG